MAAALNDAQLEILKLFASGLSDEELEDLRRLLIDFRYHRLQRAIGDLNLSREEIEAWSTGHDRASGHSSGTVNKTAL